MENKEYRYKTSCLPSSPKKLKALAVQLKKLTLDRAIDLATFSKKSFSKMLTKDLIHMKSNLENVRSVSKEDIEKITIEKVVIEKRLKTYGHRIRARGHASTSIKHFCSLNIYLRNIV